MLVIPGEGLRVLLMVRGGGESSLEEDWASVELERDLDQLVIEES